MIQRRQRIGSPRAKDENSAFSIELPLKVPLAHVNATNTSNAVMNGTFGNSRLITSADKRGINKISRLQIAISRAIFVPAAKGSLSRGTNSQPKIPLYCGEYVE